MSSVRVQMRARGTTAWTDVDAVSWECIPETMDMTVPTARIVLNNRNGRYSTKVRSRDEFRIEVDKRTLFHGAMTDDVKMISEQLMEVTAAEIDYQKLLDTICSDAYKQLGYSAWKAGSATQVGKTVTGGLRPDQVFKAGIGTRFYVQSFFETTSIIKTFTDVTVSENTVKLTTEVVVGVERFKTTGNIVLQDFENVLAGYDTMPDIGDLTVKLTGTQPTGTSLQLVLSRNSGTNTVSKTPTFASGVWTATVTAAEWAATAVRNKLSVKIVLLANGAQTSTPTVQSLTTDADIRVAGLGDLGLSEGTIDVYSDPDAVEDEIGIDFSRQNRLEVAQGAVKGALTPSTTDYPSYFAFIRSGVASFRTPVGFGTDRSATIIFGRENGTCEDVKVTTKGSGIINNLMYIGQGLPPFGEITLTANDLSGLKNAASITKYGEIQGTVQEKGIPSTTFADKRARILAKHLSSPPESYEVINPDPALVNKISLGDRVALKEPRFNVNSTFLVLSKKFSWSGETGVVPELQISNNKVIARNFVAQIGKQQQAQNLIGQGSMAPPAISFQDNFDKDHPVELAFWLPQGRSIRAVHGYFKSSKFRSYSQTTAGESSHTHGMDHTHTVPGSSHSHTVPGSLHSHTVPGSNHSHSVTGTTSAGSSTGTTDNDGSLLFVENTKTHNAYTAIANLAYPTADIVDITNIAVSSIEYVWVLLSLTGANGKDISWKLGFENNIGGGGFIDRDWAASVDDTVLVKRAYFYTQETLKALLGAGATLDKFLYSFATTDGASENINLTLLIDVYQKHTHGHDHVHSVTGQTASAVTPAGVTSDATTPSGVTSDAAVPGGVTSGASSTATTAAGSSHLHTMQHGIFENTVYPESVKLYIKDYPNVGDNPNPASLTQPFGPFGTRGAEAAAFELPSIDLSAGFKDAGGDFKTGQLMQMWLVSLATAANSTGIGRLTAHLFIDLVEGVDK